MEYFEKGKTYTFEEIEETYKNASARALEKFAKTVEDAETNDQMFNLMLTMTAMELLATMNAIMFSKRVNKESEE